jgi:plasmid maintenance system antidote protein VapI
MARNLAAAFETTPEFWLNLQQSLDLFEARQEDTSLPGPILGENKKRKPPRVG